MNYTSNTIGRHIAMRYEDAVKDFKENYLNPGEYDYWTVQLMWSDYVDYLCRDGIITSRQYGNWSTPFEYGKRIFVYNNKVVTQR